MTARVMATRRDDPNTKLAPTAIRADGVTMIGHSVGQACGLLLTMDGAVADFLQRSKAELRGLSYSDITHPDDRRTNVSRIRLLAVGDTPLRLRKRYLLPQGGHVWATVQVSKLHTGLDRGLLVGTIFSLDFRDRQAPPEALWAAAKRQLRLITERNAVLGPDLFSDGAWLVLLGLYLAEAEGRGLDIGDDHASGGVSAVSKTKWLRALRACGLVELIGDREDQPQLTQCGIDRIERLLTGTVTTDLG